MLFNGFFDPRGGGYGKYYSSPNLLDFKAKKIVNIQGTFLALKEDGTLLVWGNQETSFKRISFNDKFGSIYPATKVLNIGKPVKNIFSNPGSFYILLEDNSVMVIGSGEYGQLGNRKFDHIETMEEIIYPWVKEDKNIDLNRHLGDIVKYILKIVENQKSPDTKFILLNEFLEYHPVYIDYENDPQYNIHQWKYNHYEEYFENRG